MNNVYDKSYIALELTKISKCESKEDTFSNYSYFLEKLAFVDEVINKEMLIEENNNLKNEINKLKQIQYANISDNQIQSLKTLVISGKSDMEPYLYDAIMKYLK